jgi:hypothetical protein
MKNMLKIGFCVLLCLCCNLYTQSQNVDNKHSKETNLFEYGEPLASSEANFKNLFTNFPKLVKNADDVDLLSYKLVGVIKSHRQAKDFVKKNIYPHALGWSVSMSYEEAKDNSPEQLNILLDFSATVGSNKSELNEIVKTISEKYIQTGYEVYAVEFVCQLKKYEYYVFVDPQTKRVVTEGNIFGFRFPMQSMPC